MKSIHVVKYFYDRLGIGEYLVTIQGVINAVANNSNYINPSPSVADLQAQLNTLSALAVAVERGNFTLKPERELARSMMSAKLNQLIAYCVFTSLNSSSTFEEAKAKVKSAHLVIAEKKGHAGGSRLPAPGNLRSKSLSKAIRLEFDAVKNAYMYLVMHTEGFPTETSVWKETVTKRVKVTINDCPPAQVRSFKVYALGAGGRGEPSNCISQIAGL